MQISRLLPFLLAATLFSACQKDDEQLIMENPYSYEGANFSANARTEIALRDALAEFSAEMKKGRVAGTALDLSTLQGAYEAGSPSLSAISSEYYRNRISAAGGWLEELTKASGTIYSPGSPTGDGGVYVSNLFDENGLELEQIIEKGLFAAAMYHYAAELLDGSLNEALPDQVLALFGANPSFPNSDSSDKSEPDRFSAQYAARRDKNDGKGFYTTMALALSELQRQSKAGTGAQPQVIENSIVTIKTTWEKAIFATAINYLHSAVSKLSNTNPTDEDKAAALHSYSEVVGFVHGWRGLPADQKIITDAEIDALLLLLNAPSDGTPESYKFATDPVNELPKLTQAITGIQAIYSFTDQEIQDFRENWVAKQGR